MDVMVRYNDGPGMSSPTGVAVYFGGHLQKTKEAGGLEDCTGYLSRDGQVMPEVHNPDLWREVGWDSTKTELPPPDLLRQLSMGYDLHGTKLTQGHGLFRSPKEALITLPGELSASLKEHPEIARDILRETVQAHLREVEREAVRVRTGGGNREWQSARTLSLYYIHAENRGGEVHFHAHTMTFIPAQMPDGNWRSWDNGRNVMRLSKPGGGREKMTDAMLAATRKHGLEIELKRGVASLAPGQAQGAAVKGLDGKTIEAGSLDRKRRVEILAAQELKQELGGIAPLTPRELEIVRKVSGKLAIQDLSGERRRLALAEKLNALGMLGKDGRILPKVELVEKLKGYEEKLALAQVQLEAGISLPVGEKFRAAAELVQTRREQVASIAGPDLDLGASAKAARIRWTKDYERVLGMVQKAGGLSSKDLDKRDRDLLSKLKKAGLLEAQKVRGLNEYRLTEPGMVRLKELRVPRSEVVRSPDPGLPADLRRGLERFQRGAVALAAHRPEEHRHLAAWQGKESELVSLVFQKARGEDVLLPEETYAAALKAGKVGLVLQKEEMAKAAYVTEEPEKQFGADLRKIAARMDALGVNTPFTKGILTGSTSIEIRRGIEACRKLGLLDEGQAWAFQAGKIRELAQVIGKRFDRDKDGSDSLLDNRFIPRRHM